jgi:hypothetical protein
MILLLYNQLWTWYLNSWCYPILIWIAFNPFEKHERGCKNQWAGRTHPCMSTLLYLSEEHPHISPNTHCEPFIQLISFSFWACLWVSALSWMSYRCQRRSNVHSTKMELANYSSNDNWFTFLRDWKSSLICHLWYVISDLSSLVCHLWSVISGMSSLICHLWYVISGMSSLICHLWYVISGMSSLICHLWYVISGMSSLVCHLWYVISHMW